MCARRHAAVPGRGGHPDVRPVPPRSAWGRGVSRPTRSRPRRGRAGCAPCSRRIPHSAPAWRRSWPTPGLNPPQPCQRARGCAGAPLRACGSKALRVARCACLSACAPVCAHDMYACVVMSDVWYRGHACCIVQGKGSAASGAEAAPGGNAEDLQVGPTCPRDAFPRMPGAVMAIHNLPARSEVPFSVSHRRVQVPQDRST